jgi:broad specificity phosphatase PhoE
LHGGESLQDTSKRAIRALGKVADTASQRPIVATHGILISSVLGTVDPSFGFEAWQSMKNPHIYALDIEQGQVIGFADLG